MTESHNQFERITGFRADTIGQPGERRFRLLVEAANGRTAVLWLEKEQLFNLAVTLKRLIVVGQSAAGAFEMETSGMATMPEPTAPDFDFQIGRMGVQYNDRQGEVVLTAYSVESPEDSDIPDLSLSADRAMADIFANEAIKLCAAGRPLCPLCGAPMGPERHICPMHNGHGQLE